MGDREIGRESRRIGSSAVARTRDKKEMIAREQATQEIRKSEEAPMPPGRAGWSLAAWARPRPGGCQQGRPGMSQALGSKGGQNTLPGSAHLRDSWGTGQMEKTLSRAGQFEFISGQSVFYCGAILGQRAG